VEREIAGGAAGVMATTVLSGIEARGVRGVSSGPSDPAKAIVPPCRARHERMYEDSILGTTLGWVSRSPLNAASGERPSVALAYTHRRGRATHTSSSGKVEDNHELRRMSTPSTGFSLGIK